MLIGLIRLVGILARLVVWVSRVLRRRITLRLIRFVLSGFLLGCSLLCCPLLSGPFLRGTFRRGFLLGLLLQCSLLVETGLFLGAFGVGTFLCGLRGPFLCRPRGIGALLIGVLLRGTFGGDVFLRRLLLSKAVGLFLGHPFLGHPLGIRMFLGRPLFGHAVCL